MTGEAGREKSALPVACKLTGPEGAGRRLEVSEALSGDVLRADELEDGYAFGFPGSAEWARKLVDFVNFERACCPFFAFALAGLCEIGGGYLVWGWMREGRPLAWAVLGAAILALYGVVAALQPITEFGRVYAAYGGVFIALALAWGVLLDGFRPDRYDLLGALICVVGVAVMVVPPRG